MNNDDVGLYILRQVVSFDFLGEFDHYYKSNDPSARKVYERFVQEKYPQWGGSPYWSLANLDVCLGIFTPLFAYATRLSKSDLDRLGFDTRGKYSIECRRPDDSPAEFPTKTVIRVIRNALSHYADYLSGEYGPTVFFGPDPEIVTFVAEKYGTVTFREPKGFLEFLRDFRKCIKESLRN